MSGASRKTMSACKPLYSAMKIGNCNNGNQQLAMLTLCLRNNSIWALASSAFCSSPLYLSCSFFISGCKACIFNICFVWPIETGNKQQRTRIVSITIARP